MSHEIDHSDGTESRPCAGPKRLIMHLLAATGVRAGFKLKDVWDSNAYAAT